MTVKADVQLDCKGLACPMPIVRTKKEMDKLTAGQVLEVQATDPGSLADMKSWAQTTGHQYLGTVHLDGAMKHYLRKTRELEAKATTTYPHVITNEELQRRLVKENNLYLLDVREPAEYTFGHIPIAHSIPLGLLDSHLDQLPKSQTIYVVCRTGTRSDLAAQQLAESGFEHVVNVKPGMSTWTGPIKNESEEGST